MACRHKAGDPTCTSGMSPDGLYKGGLEMIEKGKAQIAEWGPKDAVPPTPDCEVYSIEDSIVVGDVLVLKVSYPSCAECAYEGTKILVYENVLLSDVIRWNRIDPHFRDPTLPIKVTEAPPPIARFPASDSGWKAAVTFAGRVAS